MIDQIGAHSDQLALANQGAQKAKPAQELAAHPTNEFKFFGNDGFTFFDFLDVINPLQHIPVVSTVYRSITGDEIDPSAKIAGGTLFGGPLGAAISSIDVAVEHNTGQDIADHAVAFFSGTVDNNGQPPAGPAPGGVAVASAQIPAGAQMQVQAQVQASKEADGAVQPIEAGLPPLSSFAPAQPKPAAIEIPEERFRAAGMSAIPIAKGTSSGAQQVASYQPRSLPDLGLLSDVAKPAPQVTAFNQPSPPKPVRLSDDFEKAKADVLAFAQPHRLTPKYSATSSEVSAPTGSQTGDALIAPASPEALRHQADQMRAVNQAMADAKNGWILDAMLNGLDKYQSAAGLTASAQQTPSIAVNR